MQLNPSRAYEKVWKKEKKKIVRSVTSRSIGEKRACWSDTTQQITRGWVSEMQPVTNQDLRDTHLTPRFALLQNDKYRIIDDYKLSEINCTISSEDFYPPENLDHLVHGVKDLTDLHYGQKRTKMFAMDIKDAFKCINIHPSSQDYAWLLGSYVQPFGSRRAPTSWGRVVVMIQHIIRKLLGVRLLGYVDDLFCAEPEDTIDSGFLCTRELINLLGFTTPLKKTTPPCS